MSALRDARFDRGWSQSRAIAELQKHARALGVTLPSAASLKTELSRWENGHRTPDAFYQRLFAMAYGRSAEQTRHRPGTPGARRSTSVQHGRNASRVASRLWRQDLDRRDFLKSSTFTAAAFATPTLHALVSNADAAPSSSLWPARRRWLAADVHSGHDQAARHAGQPLRRRTGPPSSVSPSLTARCRRCSLKADSRPASADRCCAQPPNWRGSSDG